MWLNERKIWKELKIEIKMKPLEISTIEAPKATKYCEENQDNIRTSNVTDISHHCLQISR